MPLLMTLPFEQSGSQAPSGISSVGQWLAATSGGVNNPCVGSPISAHFRVWNLDCNGDTLARDTAVPICQNVLEVDANAVSLCPCGAPQLAVGLGDGTVLILDDLNTGGVERGRLQDQGDCSAVHGLEYSPNGTMLAAGRNSGVYTV